MREALIGNPAQAREHALAALALPSSREVKYAAALALAFGENASPDLLRAQQVADELARRFPKDTMVQFHFLPTIRAQLALRRGDPSGAISALQSSAPYELGIPATFAVPLPLYPVFVRGEAYLAAHQGSEAAAEFRKIFGHRGVVLNEPIAVLAHLQLGRAFTPDGRCKQGKSGLPGFFRTLERCRS